MSLQNSWAFRYDTLPLKFYELDSEGYLRFIAPIAKVGNLRYWDAAKQEPYDEYVSEETLIDSLDSFKTKPLTLLHPKEKVTPANSKLYSRGLTGYSGYFDGNFLWLTGTATDQELIQKALSGECKELSCGYDALVTTRDGIKQQVKRIGNHVAFVPKGRAGSDVSIKLDSSDDDSRENVIEFVCDDDVSLLSIPNSLYNHFRNDSIIVPITSPKKGSNKSMTQILFADQVYTVDGDDAPVLKSDLTDYAKKANEWKVKADQVDSIKTQLSEANQQITDLIGAKSQLEGELQATKIKLDEALEATKSKLDQDSISKAIQTRLDIWGEVLPYIQKTDASFKPDYTLDEHQIRLTYLKTRKKDQATYLDSIDLSTESGQKLLEGMYLGLKPSEDTTPIKTHADGILETIKATETKTDSSSMEDYREQLKARLEASK